LKNKTVFKVMLLMFLFGLSVFPFKFYIESVKAWTGTIYIREDGSIDPPEAPLVTNDKVVYRLTGNITSDVHGIVVWRDNIVFDGASYYVQGTGKSGYVGIYMKFRSNVTIKNTRIIAFHTGIYLNQCLSVSITSNLLTSNKYGIWLSGSSKNDIHTNIIQSNEYGILLHGYGTGFSGSSNNSISFNSISNNDRGIGFFGFSNNNTISSNTITNNGVAVDFTWYNDNDNKFWHNNFIDNNEQCRIFGHESINIWDDGYPSGGNFWSDYEGADLDGDGVGDTTYEIDVNNKDKYPLVIPKYWNYSIPVPIIWHGTIYHVALSTNSTISTFRYSQAQLQISFYVAGKPNTVGYCNVTIPKSFLKGQPWIVKIDGSDRTFVPSENATYSFIYFTYNHKNKCHIIIQGSSGIQEPPSNIFQDLTISAIVFIGGGFLGIMLAILILSNEDKLKRLLDNYSERSRERIFKGIVLLGIVALIGLIFLFIFLGSLGLSWWIELLVRIVIIAVIVGFGTVAIAHSYD